MTGGNAPSEQRHLLWVDDEGEDAFRHERRELSKDSGWTLQWARTVNDAIDQLARQAFTAVILDQRLPRATLSDPLDEWAGCKLLYWLRRTERPSGGWPWPRDGSSSARIDTPVLPLEPNTSVPVAVVSICHYPEIRLATLAASQADASMRYYTRPVDIRELRAWLDSAFERRRPRGSS